MSFRLWSRALSAQSFAFGSRVHAAEVQLSSSRSKRMSALFRSLKTLLKPVWFDRVWARDVTVDLRMCAASESVRSSPRASDGESRSSSAPVGAIHGAEVSASTVFSHPAEAAVRGKGTRRLRAR